MYKFAENWRDIGISERAVSFVREYTGIFDTIPGPNGKFDVSSMQQNAKYD